MASREHLGFQFTLPLGCRSATTGPFHNGRPSTIHCQAFDSQSLEVLFIVDIACFFCIPVLAAHKCHFLYLFIYIYILSFGSFHEEKRKTREGIDETRGRLVTNLDNRARAGSAIRQGLSPSTPDSWAFPSFHEGLAASLGYTRIKRDSNTFRS